MSRKGGREGGKRGEGKGGGEGEAAGGRNREHVLDGNCGDWWRGTHGTGALEPQAPNANEDSSCSSCS